jgi:hypothetical protein
MPIPYRALYFAWLLDVLAKVLTFIIRKTVIGALRRDSAINLKRQGQSGGGIQANHEVCMGEERQHESESQ